jgi:two-component system response regulator YesN
VKNIILVDDNRYIIEALALTIAMNDANCNILKAKNGKEAVDILREIPVDLILTDINMPVMDGFGLIRQRNNHWPHVPLVAMTGDTSPEVMEKLGGLGITECLEKPFDYATVTQLLIRKLDTLTHVHGLQPAAARYEAEGSASRRTTASGGRRWCAHSCS